jgi:eukaryotic-like serine/threonine-protein kinase
VIGTVLDKYEILQKIGEGGMATVYRGRHLALGRDVAIKVLHPHLSASVRNRNRFAREARAIEHLDHDNILKIYDYSGTEHDDCYIVTEFVDGVTLQDVVAEHGHVPSEVVAILGIRLGEALSYAHHHDIIHRDLKPENVMMKRDGTVKLMDFGIARFLDESNLTMTGALVGSPAYMSPEQAMEKVLDSRSDLFSLGTLLYHLVTGQLPFSGNNASIVLRNIIEGNRPDVVELRPDVSGRLADLVERLLETEPDDRPNTAEDVVAELRKALTEVRIDPDDEKWSLRAWLQDPASYAQRLDEHLKTVLLAEGKAMLKERDHLEALRLFNRLLSIDEGNAEVLTLVQGMHTDVPREAPSLRTWGIGVGIVVAAFVVTWGLWPRGQEGSAAVTTEPSPPLEAATQTVSPQPEAIVASMEATPIATPPAPAAKAPTVANRVMRPKEREPVPDAEIAVEPPLPARLTVDPGLSWGVVSVDGKELGRAGQGRVYNIEPGHHRLKVTNDTSKPYETEFDAAPNQPIELKATLEPLPYTVFFKDFAPSCVVGLDGQTQGPIESLGGKLAIPAPDPNNEYNVTVQCEKEEPRAYPLRRLRPKGDTTIQP